MKKLLIILLLCAPLAAQTCTPSASQTCTPNVGLAQPVRNSQNWDTALNSNFTLLDNLLSASSSAPAFKTASLNGALIVDGVKYTTVASAVTAANAQEVYVPAGTYQPTAQIATTHPIWLHGAGINQTIIQPTTALASALFSFTTTSEGLKVSDLTIDMTNAAGQDVFDLTGNIKPIFQNVRIIYPTGGSGAAFSFSGVAEFSGTDIIITRPGIGFLVNGDSGGEDFWRRITVESPSTAGFKITRTTVTDVGGYYLHEYKVTNPYSAAAGAGFVCTSTVGNAIVPLWLFNSVADSQAGSAGQLSLTNCATVTSIGGWYRSGNNVPGISLSGVTNFLSIGDQLASGNADLVLAGSDTTVTMVAPLFVGSTKNVSATGATLSNIRFTQPSYAAGTPMSAADASAIANATPSTDWTSGAIHIPVSGGQGSAQSFGLCDKDTTDTLPCKWMRVSGTNGAFQILNNSFGATMLSIPDTAQITTPAVTGNMVVDSATQTLTNKSTSAGPLSGTVASGTAAMTTAAIGSGACGSTVTVAATGVATTDAIETSFNAAVGANPGVLILQKWPTSGNVNFAYCNPTAGSVTPSAATINWRVGR